MTTQAPAVGLPPLRPYQVQVARAILRRVAGRHGGSVSVEIARQGGKNELSAQVGLATLLMNASAGGTAVKCAPTLDQARISLGRLRRRAVDAGLGSIVEPVAREVRCGRARALVLSAERGANVVGHTADLLLEVDEAQDVEVDKFDRDFRPMAASTDAPVAYYGTPWAANSLLEQAKATHRTAERAGGPRRHFRFDWEEVAQHVPAYRRYVEGERERLGERHPLFRTQYLLEVVNDTDRLLDAAALAQLEGHHARLRAPVEGERYVAGLDLGGPARASSAGRDHDWTVLTIARVVPAERGQPRIEVVELQAWQGAATEPLIETLADRLRRVWRIRGVAVDATGLGGPIADLLASRLPRGVVHPVVFSADRKSRLGFGLLAAAHSGRLRLFGADGSGERFECRRQLEVARVAYGDGRSMRFDVDLSEGHDDYLMSLALCVDAAHLDGGPRAARGRLGHHTQSVEAVGGPIGERRSA
ncbi:MAG: hypothetical protein R3C39_03995 [Dehalococcoidia bacterium]